MQRKLDMKAKIALVKRQIDELLGEEANEETMVESVPCHFFHSCEHHVARCPSWLVEEDTYKNQVEYVEKHKPTSFQNNRAHENNYRFE